ncbi:MAG: UvrD-helicase domain-containing protein [Pseudomonadota bacterium]
MSAAPSDAAARAQALDTTQSFIVQAPAGSGKTGLLIQRLLGLLASVDDPEQVVAITFTRKAAAEMRQRLADALAAADEDEPEANYERETWLRAKALRRHDQRQGWGLFDNPSRLRIMTIDAFCSSLVRQMPVLSQFGAAQAIDAAPHALYRRAAARLLASLEEDDSARPALETLLRHTDNDVQRIEKMLVSMLMNRDRWLPFVSGHGELDRLREPLEVALECAVSTVVVHLDAVFGNELKEGVLSFIRYAANNVSEDHYLAIWRDCTAFPSPGSDAVMHWRALRKLLLKSPSGVRKKTGLNKSHGFPGVSTLRNEDEKSARGEAASAAGAVLEALEGDSQAQIALKQLDKLPARTYTDGEWAVLRALLTLLPRCVAELMLLFGEQGTVDFSQQAQRALAALGDDDSPTDLALTLDYQIRHLLIDEFQDTSRSQFALAKRLVSGWEPGDGRTLFLVGDPMQSIYRFRDAEVGLFLQAQQYGIGDVALTPLTLTANFRSKAAIVEHANRVFKAIFPSRALATEGAVTFSSAQARRDGPDDLMALVETHLLLNREQEAQHALQIIERALAASPDADIALLVRGRSHLKAIMPALERAGVDFQAVDIVPLGQSQAVMDLWVLTRALLHLADRTAWLGVLRAPWCGLTLSDLHALLGAHPDLTVWERIADADMDELSGDGARRLGAILPALRDAMARRATSGWRALVESLWNRLGGPGCLVGEHEQRNAQTYLNMLESLEDDSDALTLERLDRALADRYAETPSSPSTRVRVMTIHRAKGLEFGTVILPGLDIKPPPRMGTLLHWLEFDDDTGQSQVLLAPLPSSQDKASPTVDYMKEVERRREANELRRLLYVAATRARDALHWLACAEKTKDGDTKAPTKGTLLHALWPALDADFLASERAVAMMDTDTTSVAPPGLVRLVVDELETQAARPDRSVSKVSQIDSRTRDRFGDRASRAIGTAVHTVFQIICEVGLEPWRERYEATLTQQLERGLIFAGTPHGHLAEALEHAERAVRGALSDPRGRWILSDHAQAQSEWALSAWLDGRVQNVVLDRTFVDEDGVRWIIDYKTSSPSKDPDTFMDDQHRAYRDQLNLYGRIVSQLESQTMGRPRKTQLALYFPMLPAWRAWDSEEV